MTSFSFDGDGLRFFFSFFLLNCTHFTYALVCVKFVHTYTALAVLSFTYALTHARVRRAIAILTEI